MTKYMAAVLLLVAAMSAQPSTNKVARLDIPAISREAHGAVVSIVVSDKNGHPLAQGSGFLISKDGQVVTNYHVIRNGSSAIIKLPNGAFFAVDGVLSSDKDRDVAIIKAHGADFQTLTLGDSDRLQVGEEVVAIGNPLSLESTVSNGIVSAIRTVEDEGRQFVQITAPISPGSSGGPLFNMSGQVVGITTSHIKGGENLNFAIPINDVKPMLLTRSSKARSLPHEGRPVRAGPATGTSLPETLAWMNNTFNRSNREIFLQLDAEIKWKFSFTYEGCNMTIKSRTEDWITDASFRLGDIDPSSVQIIPHQRWGEHICDHSEQVKADGLDCSGQAEVQFSTRSEENVITAKTSLLYLEGANYYTDQLSQTEFGMQDTVYARRFAKAFRHAVELCGGKTSAF